ncbi:MAG: hypothetical protein ACK4PK_10490 [Alphaproteobacteria bacterium]
MSKRTVKEPFIQVNIDSPPYIAEVFAVSGAERPSRFNTGIMHSGTTPENAVLNAVKDFRKKYAVEK